MLRDEASAFLYAGGRIEAGDVVRMLRVALPTGRGSGPDDGHAIALLQAVGGLQAYRRAVPAPAHAGPVARFLLFERNCRRRGRLGQRRAAHSRRPGAQLRADPALESALGPTFEFRRSGEGDADLGVTCREVSSPPRPAGVGTDPTNRQLAGERDVKIGPGRQYARLPSGPRRLPGQRRPRGSRACT